MKDNRRHLNLKWQGTSFELWRLSEEEYDQLRQSSLPIKEDHTFLWWLYLSERNDPDRLTLPKAFLTLEHLFGKTSDSFDDWKGSFRFPLLLVVKKSQDKFFYMLNIYDHRGSLSFAWYRVLEDGVDGYDIYVYQEPFEKEFSREEINQFLSYFYGYLIGVSDWAIPALPPPFLKRIDSNSILYGCRAGELFEEEFESEEDYQQAITEFEQTYGPEKSADKSKEIQLLLRQIISEAQ